MSGVENEGVTMIGGKMERTGMVTVALVLVALVGCAGSGMPHPPEPPPMEKSEY